MRRHRISGIARRRAFAAPLLAALLTLTSPSARAGLLGLWQLDETSGTTAPNRASGGTEGTLYNGPQWTYDGQRGLILRFDGSNDYVNAGSIPALSTTDDFTWAFWTYQQQGVNSDVALGNRWDAATQTGNEWIKFTAAKFEYRPGGPANDIDYTDIPQNQWVHHAVVKDGASLAYYRDGVPGGTSTVTSSITSRPFYIGGDKFSERWQGRIDDVAVFDEPLSQTQVQAIMGGDFTAFGVARPTAMTDGFGGSAVDTTKWKVMNKGLETTADGGYDPPTVAGGTLTLGGTTSHSYWAGKTLCSLDAFTVPADGEVRFEVDRVGLTGSGSAYRSSVWMYADGGHFLHFAQNIGESNWQFNAGDNNPTGGGVQLSRANSITDGGLHKMTLVNDGAYVKMYLDGRWLGSHAANFAQFQVMLTGQARASGDTVAAVFDNAAVSTRALPFMVDNFNGGGIDARKWQVINKGLENQGSFPGNLAASVQDGELVIQGSTGAQYWYGVTLQSRQRFGLDGPRTFIVDRDALDRSGSAGRSGLWLWADDDHFLFFGQNIGENGWQYNYADGPGVGQPGGGGVNLSAFDGLDGDPGFHEMQVIFHALGGGAVKMDMYLDGKHGATQQFDNWGDSKYYFMLSGMPRASGDSVFVAFDNVRMIIPEPATLAVLGAGFLALARRRRT